MSTGVVFAPEVVKEERKKVKDGRSREREEGEEVDERAGGNVSQHITYIFWVSPR